MLNRRIIALSAMIAVGILSSGCGKKEKNPEPEPIMSESTETVTEAPTEILPSAKEIQDRVESAASKGSATYRITVEESSSDRIVSFEQSADVVSLASEDGKGFFANKEASRVNSGEGWMESSFPFSDIWGMAKTGACLIGENTVTVGSDECYQLRMQQVDDQNFFKSILEMEGMKDPILTGAVVDYYIGKENGRIERVDLFSNFAAEGIGEGTVLGSFVVSEYTDGVAATLPEVEIAPKPVNPNIVDIDDLPDPEVIEEEEPDDYVPGTVSDNLYTNELFGIQIPGGELFSYNQEQTESLRAQYQELGSSYAEEAYGEGDGIRVNIVTVKGDGITKESAITKYMTDSSASNVQAAGTKQIGKNLYISSSASVQGSLTKTYGFAVDQRALLVTIYYNDEAKAQQFHENLYDLSEDATWKEESWSMKDGRFTLTTPKGYKLVAEDCNDLYACMSTKDIEVNAFILENSSRDGEYSKAVESTEKTSKEIVSETDVVSEKYGAVDYVCLLCKEADYEYYNHVGIFEADGCIVRLYAVTVDQADLGEIFGEFADGLAVTTETESETDIVS